jgi:hypothetical protein
MVTEQLRPHGVTDERVLQAMASVPREEFLHPNMRRHAYEDRALAIDCGQTISQPLVVALMIIGLFTRCTAPLEAGRPAGRGGEPSQEGRQRRARAHSPSTPGTPRILGSTTPRLVVDEHRACRLRRTTILAAAAPHVLQASSTSWRREA